MRLDIAKTSGRLLRVGLMMVVMVLASWSLATAQDRCAAPQDITANIAPLPHVAEVLKPGGTLNVLTVGSATVFSPDESLKPGSITAMSLGMGSGSRGTDLPMPSAAAFPLQMGNDLKELVPGLNVSVTVRGGRGLTATEMADIIRQELKAHAYQLVIWQTGTVEAVRNVPAGDFFQTLQDGAAVIADANANLVLVDPQYSRFLHANADLDPYTQSMQQIAATPGAILFHRFDLMRYWVGGGSIDLERTAKAQRLATVEALHACLGVRLAHMILDAAHQAS